MIMVDTSVLIDYLRTKDVKLLGLMKKHGGAVCGVIRAEILCGALNAGHRKKLDDARVGMHRVPALLMQEETCRIILEPVGRSVPGAEGLVDLYLLPGYDDIAGLYFYDGRWNLHYILPNQKAVATPREAAALPLDRSTLEQVLSEMKQNAT